MTPEEIAKLADNYKSAQTHKLIRLADDPAGLPAELVPMLQKELLARGEQEAALNLTHYLVELKELEQAITPEQARAEIMDRLKAGESMESIALKFKERGLNVFDELNRETQTQENTFDYIASLKEKGLKDDELDKKLMADLAIDQQEVDVLKEKMRKNANANFTIGIAITSITLVLSLLSGRFSIGAILILGVGVWRIIEGSRGLSNN